MESLKKNSFFNAINNIFNLIIPFIVSIYVSRILLSDGLGKIVYAQNICSYFVILATLGLPTYGVKELAKSREDAKAKNVVFTELFCINVIASIVASGCFLLIVFSANRFHKDLILFLICGIQIFINFLNVDWVYQGNEDYVFIATRGIAVKLLSLICVLLFVKSKKDYLIYALISSGVTCLNYLVNIFHLRKIVQFDFSEISLIKHIKPLVIYGISVCLSTIYSKIDITMLGWLTNESAIGIYNNSHKLIEIAIMLCTSISAVFLPRLSYFYSKNKAEFYSTIQKGLRVLYFLCFPMSVGLLIMGPQIITILYGNDFLSGGLTIRIFALMIIIRGCGDLLCYQISIATGNEEKRLPALIIATLVNVILNYTLIPRFSQYGAAIASVVSELLVNTILFVSMKKLLNLQFDKVSLYQAIISSCIMGFIVIVIKHIFLNLYLQVFIGLIAGVVSYFIINILLNNSICKSAVSFLRLRCIKKDR